VTGPCRESARIQALVDGQLSGPEADRAAQHLGDCVDCQAVLADMMQLAAVEDELRPAERADALGSWPGERSALGSWPDYAPTSEPEPAPVPITRARPRRRVAAIAAAPIAAAAAWAITWSAGEPPVDEAQDMPRLALAPQRAIEARLTWPPLAGHRPYSVARSAGDVGEAAPLSVLADLEKRGDLRGVGALFLAGGDLQQASIYMERAPGAPGLAADRAALALVRGNPEAALVLADAALANADDPAARWNRALALRDLGLPYGAADELRRAADRREPGWADEAKARAAALDAAAADRRALIDRLFAGGAELVAGGNGFSLDDARRAPGVARVFLHDALRAAPSAERVRALRPLAEALDALDPHRAGSLTAAVDRAAAADFARRAPLARTYAAIVDRRPPEGAERARYLAALRAAGQDDLLIGALVRLGPDGRIAADHELPELVRLARATRDPWFELLAAEQEATMSARRGAFLAAEAILLPALERCEAAALPYRCARVASLLAEAYVDLHRLPEARRALDAALRASRAAGVSLLDEMLIAQLADLHAVGDDASGSGLSLTRAYARELVLRNPGSCSHATWAHELVAMVLVNQLRVDEARRELAGARPAGQPCADYPHNMQSAFVGAHVLRERGTPAEVAALRAAIAGLRADPATTPGHRALIDHAEGRLIIDRDRAAGEELLRRSIRAAAALPDWSAEGRKARAYSYAVLTLAAAQRGDADGTLALLAEESGLAAPTRCALGVAVDDRLRMAAARGADGRAALHFDRGRRSTDLDPAALVPPEVAAHLAGCDAIDVLARPPVHGLPGLLPDAVAWRYVSARGRPMPAPPAAPRRLVVSDVEPPAALGLPRLAPWSDFGPGQRLTGADATPARVLAAMRGATEIELHAHGLVNLGESDASLLALSPDPTGRYALTAADVRGVALDGAPLVVLAACRASRGAAVLHEPWSLPAAFVFAGARAVVASAAPIPDGDADAFFGDLRARVERGAAAAVALRDARQAWLAAGRSGWVRDLIVFE
jgi:hypothetical protein